MAIRSELLAPEQHPWRFLLLAFGLSWSVWLLAFISERLWYHRISVVLLAAAPVALAASAAVLAGFQRNGGIRREYWRSIVDIRRISLLGLALSLLAMPAVTVAATYLDDYRNGHPVLLGPIFALSAQPRMFLKTFAIGLVISPFLEEVTWRGAVLVPLQRRYGALLGATVLGVVRAIWHLPLFFFVGYLRDLGLFTAEFWRFFFDIVALDLMAAALFNAMGSSTLAAVLFHISSNAAGALVVLTPVAVCYRAGFDCAIASLLILVSGGRLFRRVSLRNQ